MRRRFSIYMDYSGNLPVLADIVKNNRVDNQTVSLFVIQHIKKNTVEFIRLLRVAGFRDITVIGKPYSVDTKALSEMRKYASVHVPTLQKMEQTAYVGSLIQNIVRKQRYICLDLGGHCSKYFQSLSSRSPNLLGVIEETKNGIWFDNPSDLKFPLASVAGATLKQYGECYFVAQAIIRNTEHILINEFQETLAGKHILVLGYGTIGGIIAPLLKRQARVAIYDIKPSLMLKANIDGFEVIRDLTQLSSFDVIIGITGQYVLKRELTKLKPNVVLVNGSTRKREFDLSAITNRIKNISEEKKYTNITLTNRHTIRLLAHGYPVNFFQTESVPEYILDLLYSEMFLLTEKMITEKFVPGYYPIENCFPDIEEAVASLWLNHWAF